MKKFYFYMLALAALLCASVGAKAGSWPANYDGVMLQGFYWDAYKSGQGFGTTKWTDLTNMADELSKYFDIIWVPNSGRANGENGGGNGYMPIYWFSNHSCAYGSEAELKTMLQTFKDKGVGIIEDCVINHRVGVSNWYNFPSETWNGQTYHLTDGAICSTDEMWKGGGYGCPYARGNADEGEDFDGARDLDHTNANVQTNCKAYVKYLTSDRGYAGLRYDMCKGFSGYYVGMYNANAGVKFSVGEYFDANYDLVKRWIDQTAEYNNGAGKSAAFDFPCKYQINKALGGGGLNCSELVWKANGVTDQPAGMIHYGYQQYAVTFVDNHDTFRDGSKFASDYNVMAANAFILFSPGTPCIFWPHYYSNKSAMQKLISARKAVGIHNQSAVSVLRTGSNIYVAEITGSKGKAIVKIGSENYTPPTGYTLAASGNNYAVWTTNQGGVDVPDIPSTPYKIYFKNTKNWNTPYVHYWGGDESTWPGVPMSQVSGTADIWSYTVPAGTIGLVFNAGDGDASKTGDFVAQPNHLYTFDGDQGVYSGADNPDPDPKPGTYPASLYMMGHVDGCDWNTDKGVEAKGTNGVYNWSSVTIDDCGDGSGYIAFSTILGADWDAVNSGDRYGASSTDEPLALGQTGTIVLYAANVNASGCPSWKIAPGNYSVTADLANMKVTLATAGSKPDPDPDPIPGTYPATVYVMGNINGYGWATNKGLEAKGNNGVYEWPVVSVDDAGAGSGYFAFVTTLGTTGNPDTDWDEVINLSDRYGAPSANTPVQQGQTVPVTLYAAGVDASASQSWMIASGSYALTLNLATMQLTVGNVASAVEGVEVDDNAPVEYFNLQGVRVANPTPGLYIRVQGNRASKVLVK